MRNLLAAFVLLWATTASAQSGTSESIFCNTKEQMERYLELTQTRAPAAEIIDIVNDEYGENECGFVAAIWEVETIFDPIILPIPPARSAEVHVVKVRILGVIRTIGSRQAVTPVSKPLYQFSFKVGEIIHGA